MIVGRDARAGYWIQTWPRATVGALCVAGLCGVGAFYVLYCYRWTPLQRHYLSAYTVSGLADAVGLWPTSYRLLTAVDALGVSRFARNQEVGETPTGDGRSMLTITAWGDAHGVRRLRFTDERYAHAAVHAFLGRVVYGGRAWWQLTTGPLWAAGIVLVCLLVVAVPADARRVRDRRQGQRLRGPRAVTVRDFNRSHAADGLAITMQSGPAIRLPRDAERSHILLMGASGSGKSAVIRQILPQIRERGETAIVLDPTCEFTAQFYRPEVGDIILNPLDARCPFWVPGEELRDDAEALTMAQALFVERPGDKGFFVDAPRQICAFLLTQRPTAGELVHAMTDGYALDRVLAGTPLQALIDRSAPAQRTGVLASLGMVANTLSTLPAEDNGQGCWSAHAWAAERRGWVFVTSTPQTQARLIPLQSLWLDMLILRLQDGLETGRVATWFVLDEVADLHRLPQLHKAITTNRKYNNPMVIGCQGRAQLDARYGHDAETMIAQAKTKLFLRTAEPKAAAWASDAIGTIETQRLEESRRDAWGFGDDNHQLSLRRGVEPLVMASELGGLPDLHGYLKLGNDVAAIQVKYVAMPSVQPGFVPRAVAGPAVQLQAGHGVVAQEW